MLIIDNEQVRAFLPMEACIQVMRHALCKLAQGESKQFLRTVSPLPGGGLLGLMPSYLDNRFFGAKVISVFHSNLGTGHPSHQGGVLLFDSQFGRLLAMADANAITEIRTGAVSGLATSALSREDSHVAAFLGAGAQARSHLAALLCVRPIDTITIYDPRPEAAHKLASEAQAAGVKAVVCDTVQKAVEPADIISTLTSSHTPILLEEWVRPGTHINAVGACAAKDRELDSQLVAASRFYCDSVESVVNESGDYLYPKEEGLIDKSHIVGELGQLLAGRIIGRRNPQEITVFEALGLAVEDIAAASFLYEQMQ